MTKHLRILLLAMTTVLLLTILVGCSDIGGIMIGINDEINDVKDVFLGTINPDTSCDHEWYAADCKTPKTCGKCGEMEGEKLGHTTENGTCDRCGKVIGDSSKSVE